MLCKAVVPQPFFLAPGADFVEDDFSHRSGRGMVSGWFKGLTFIVLYFYDYYISSTSDHQALNPRGWGPLL